MRVRTILAALTAIVLVGAVTALTLINPDVRPPNPAAAPHVTSVELAPQDVTQVCLTGTHVEGQAQGDEEFGDKSVATRTLTSASVIARSGEGAPSATYQRTGDAQTFALSGPAAAVLSIDNERAPGIITAPPAGGARAALVGGTVTLNSGGDARGLGAATCQPPTTDAWLLGGATTLGASAELVLVNPTKTVATVTTSLYSERGPVDARTAATTSVAPGATERVLLESSASDIERLAVHVSVTGGAIVPAIVYGGLDGITPLGTGIISAGQGPARSQLIAGAALAGGKADALRLVNPGEGPARVSVRLIGADGSAELPGATDLTIDSGAVQDVVLDAVAEGDYAIAVTASEPVLASARTTIDSEGGARSTTWVPSAQTSTELLVPVITADGLAARVSLAAGEAAATVTYRPVLADGSLGEEANLEVPATTERTLSLPEGTRAVRLTASSPISAATILAMSDAGLGAVLPAIEDSDVRRTVAVRLGDFD